MRLWVEGEVLYPSRIVVLRYYAETLLSHSFLKERDFTIPHKSRLGRRFHSQLVIDSSPITKVLNYFEGSNNNFPVVLLPSKSSCALLTSLKG
jgi:hypothetical protein